MKKFFVVIAISLFVLTILSSCKSKDCPAYGQVEVEQIEVNS